MPANGSSSSMIDGFGGQRARDLGAAALAARQRHRRRIAQPGQVEFVEQLVEPRLRAPPCRARPVRAPPGCSARPSARGRSRFPAADSRGPRIARRYIGRPVISSPSSMMRPAVGLHQPHHRIEAGRLARAVGPEQPDHLAACRPTATRRSARRACRRTWRSRRPTARSMHRASRRSVDLASQGRASASISVCRQCPHCRLPKRYRRSNWQASCMAHASRPRDAREGKRRRDGSRLSKSGC